MMMENTLPDNFSALTIASNADNLKLSALISKPDTAPIATVQLVHGMCEHKERYIGFMQYLNSKGYVCIIHDHRGHGDSVKSEKDLGYFYSGGYKAMVEDVYLVNQHIKKQYPGLKLFLFGHSMGSMVVRSFTKNYDSEINGLIVCGSPSNAFGSGIGIQLAKSIGTFKGDHYRSNFLQNLSLGQYSKKFPEAASPNAWICSDPKVVEQYDANPKCNYMFTANGFRNLFGLVKDCYSRKHWKMQNSNLSIWFISGENDPCYVDLKKFNSAVDNMRKIGYTDVSSKIYPNMQHEILNEIGKEKVWGEIWKKFEKWK